jgi:CHAT domain-containing protein
MRYLRITFLILTAFSFTVNGSVNLGTSNKSKSLILNSSPHQALGRLAYVGQETAEFIATMESAQLMALYYRQRQLARAQRQHQTTLRLFKTLPPVELIRGAFVIQSLFGYKDYPIYIIEYSEIAFGVAVENNYVELAAQSLGQVAALYWTRNYFPQAMKAFRVFGAFADPFIAVDPYTRPGEIIRQDLIFKDFLRRYVRFMFNTYSTSHRPVCVQNDCLNLAWEMTEKIKSRLFRAEILRGALERLSDRERQQAQLLLQSVKQAKLRRIYALYQSNNLLGRSTYDGEIQNIESQLSRVLPEYKDLAQGVASTTTVSDLLSPNETLLSFFYTDNPRPVFVWKLEKNRPPTIIQLPADRADLDKIINTEDLYNSIDFLKARIERNPSLDELMRLRCPPNGEYTAPSKIKMSCLPWFGKNVIQPLSLQPNQPNQPNRRLIIATDQNLAALPFDLLPWDQSQLMMDVFDITYVPSTTVFYQLRKKHLQDGSTYTNYKYTYAGFSYKNQEDPNNKLTWADSEIENAAEGIPQALKMPDARESDLYANSDQLASTRYIHIVTHNNLLSNTDNSFYLQFGKDSGGDGRLTGYEIVTRLRNNAELVVLSACQTALRTNLVNLTPVIDPSTKNPSGVLLMPVDDCICKYGDSFSNLSGAFFAAGSKRLMLTQWRLPDSQGTQEFITRFFANLKSGKSPAESLRLAKQEMREEYLKAKDDETKQSYNPAFWAGFILVGD